MHKKRKIILLSAFFTLASYASDTVFQQEAQHLKQKKKCKRKKVASSSQPKIPRIKQKKEHIEQKKEDKRRLKCPVSQCGHRGNTLSDIRRHVLRRHVRGENKNILALYACRNRKKDKKSTCPFMCLDRKDLNKHRAQSSHMSGAIINIQNNQPQKTSNSLYKCPYCEYSSADKERVIHHLNTKALNDDEHGQSVYICKCHHRIHSNEKNLILHLAAQPTTTTTGYKCKQRYCCTICHTFFTSFDELRKHMYDKEHTSWTIDKITSTNEDLNYENYLLAAKGLVLMANGTTHQQSHCSSAGDQAAS